MAREHPSMRFRALVHRTTLPPLNTVEPVEGRLDDEDSLLPALIGVDTVVHLAATTHASKAETYFAANLQGTASLLRASRRSGIRRVIFISTRAIHPPCGDYARSKLAAENVVRMSGLLHTILRFSEVYGGGSSEGIDALCATVRTWPVVPCPLGAADLAPLWIDDATDAIRQTLLRPALPSRTYTTAGPRTYTLRRIVEIVAKTLGVRRLVLPVPLTFLKIAARLPPAVGGHKIRYDQIDRMRCAKESDIEAAQRDLGFAPRAFEEGVRALLAQER
jgi:NADH dehydrogenase